MSVNVQFTNPDLQAKIDQWVTETGRSADELVEDVVTGYFDQLAETRETLDNRYDEIISGKVKLIPGEEVEAHFRSKVASRRLGSL